MQKISFFLVAVFFSHLLHAQNIIRLDSSSITAKDLDNKIEQLMKDAAVTGIAISVFNESRSVYHKVFGYKNAETRTSLQTGTNFYGASLSKAVFSVLVMKLVEENIIRQFVCIHFINLSGLLMNHKIIQ